MRPRHLGIALLVAFVWGLNFIAAKEGTAEMPPFLLLCLRFIVATLPLLPFVKRPKEISWTLLFSISMCMGVGHFAAVFTSLKLGLAPGLASLLLQTQVIFTAFLSRIIFRTHISQRQVIGIVISFFGLGFIASDVGGESTAAGFTCIMVGAILGAFTNILLRKAGKADTFSLIIWMGLLPPVPLFILGLLFDGWDAMTLPFTHMSWRGLSALAYTIVGATWIGSTAWAYLFKKYDASIVAPYSLLVPIVGISASWLIYGEVHPLSTILGCILVFAGLVINQIPVDKILKKKKRKTSLIAPPL